MTQPLPIVLVPGLLASARLYGEQLPELWRWGPVTIADHTRDHSMAAIARRILAAAPPSFALVGLSMGGYIAFEIARQAPDRVARLALLDTTARPDTPEQTQRRRAQIALARGGRFAEVLDLLFPVLIHPQPPERRGLGAAGTPDGRRHRARGVHPPATGDHGPPRLVAETCRHRLPDAGLGRRRR
jgi:pimeloyl-ACP methyl ester carboxylesterase